MKNFIKKNLVYLAVAAWFIAIASLAYYLDVAQF
jgi:hypothetical protein